jgi:microcystin-dependent protein
MAWTDPRTWVTSETVTSTIMNAHVRDNLNAVLPVGAMIRRAAVATTVETAVESRWLECNGVAVSRTTYATLFAYLNGLSTSLPYGTGDGSTTFTLPDFRGRQAVGHGSASGHADVSTLGTSDGNALANRTMKHRHTVAVVASVNFAGGGSSAMVSGGSTTTSGNTNNTDTGSYLVDGVVYIKYTS